jgi:hypothetical protein
MACYGAFTPPNPLVKSALLVVHRMSQTGATPGIGRAKTLSINIFREPPQRAAPRRLRAAAHGDQDTLAASTKCRVDHALCLQRAASPRPRPAAPDAALRGARFRPRTAPQMYVTSSDSFVKKPLTSFHNRTVLRDCEWRKSTDHQASVRREELSISVDPNDDQLNRGQVRRAHLPPGRASPGSSLSWR